MFLKSYTRLSAPKLMEQLNANIHYQIFCGIRISSANPLTNYKLIDDIILELSNRLMICVKRTNNLPSVEDPHLSFRHQDESLLQEVSTEGKGTEA